MPENVAILLAVLIAADAVLVVVALWRNRSQRRGTARHDAAIDAIASTSVAPSAGPRPSPAGSSGAAGSSGLSGVAHAMAASRTDPLTETLLPGEWTRILADEDARVHRYGRRATVVLIELDGLEAFVSVLGQPAGDRVLVAVADTLKRHARSSDHVARVGPGRFGLLLPETGEVEAINLTERLRSLCELWLASGSIALRLAIGWASPSTGAGLAEAYVKAAERMYAEERRNERQVARDAVNGSARSTELEGVASPA